MNTQATPDNRTASWKGYLLVALACTGLMVAAGVLRSTRPFISVSYYVSLHLVMELSSIVVSFAVAATAWYGHRQTRSLRDLVISVSFLTTGVVDLVHTLSYKGMPNFLSLNDPGTAAAYWLFARLVVGVGLLAACLLDPRKRSSRWTPALLVGLAAALVGAGVFLMVRNSPASGLIFYNEAAGGLTPLKIGLEYVVIALYAGAFILLTTRLGWEARVARLLRYALIISIFAELAFTLYLSPYGLYNAVGHVLKTASYYLIFVALFVSEVIKPYEQLADANTQLQGLYVQAREQAVELQQSVSRIGNALSASLELDEALNQIAELVGGVLHAGCAIAASTDQLSSELKVAMKDEHAPEVRLSEDVILNISRHIISTRRTIIMPDVMHSEWASDEVRGVESLMSAPMVFGDNVLGAISVFSDKPDAFGATERQTLEAFASHAAVAVQNALRYGLESHVASVLQNAILAHPQLSTPRFGMAYLYEPAVNGTMVGGDFFDVVELPNGRVAISLGDVSGKGVEAAVYTAMVKYTLRAYLKTTQSPAEVMGLLNEAVSEAASGDMFITMFFGVLDTETGELQYVNAGHVPPIYAREGGCTSLEPTGPILGLSAGLSFGCERIVLESGGVLLLYTDGISEARRDGDLFGSERVEELVMESRGMDAQSVVTRVRNAAVEFGGGELRDDAVILVLTVS